MDMKVLVADDASLHRERMTSLLSGIDGVTSVAEAIDCAGTRQAIRNGRPDVLILDMFMPDGSGLDVLGWLAGRRHQPRVYVLTAWADAEVRERCLAAGAQAVYDKGTGLLQVIEAIETAAQTTRTTGGQAS